jgi:hypothetical protein
MILQSARNIVESARATQGLAEASGGPESKRAANDLLEAAIVCEQVAARGATAMQLALGLKELGQAAKAWERACKEDGSPDCLPDAKRMASSYESNAEKALRAAQQSV